MSNYATYINAQTQDYVLLDGKFAYGNSLATEAYTRLTTPIGSYKFDNTFGCMIPNWFNTRMKVTVSGATASIRDALQPMITGGRIKSFTSTIYGITKNTINYSVSIVDINGTTFNLSVPYLNYSISQLPL